ncbi:hypothetical protein PHYC_02840 [Phycisphaerales bacterium]|nr:hypothetical protein PHYC_02840 [Phycisphaerales bacterium]
MTAREAPEERSVRVPVARSITRAAQSRGGVMARPKVSGSRGMPPRRVPPIPGGSAARTGTPGEPMLPPGLGVRWINSWIRDGAVMSAITWYCRRCGYALQGPERCPECGSAKSACTAAETRDFVNTAALPAWVLLGIGLVTWALTIKIPSSSDGPLWLIGALTTVPMNVLAGLGIVAGILVWRTLRKDKTLHGARLATTLLLPWVTLVWSGFFGGAAIFLCRA